MNKPADAATEAGGAVRPAFFASHSAVGDLLRTIVSAEPEVRLFDPPSALAAPEDGLADRRDQPARGGAIEQGDVQFLLQRADAPRHGGVVYRQLARGGRDRALPRDREAITQVVPIDALHICTSNVLKHLFSCASAEPTVKPCR